MVRRNNPKEVEAYDIFQLTGDLVGLVNALGGEPVVIVGHDWGAGMAQSAEVFRSDLFSRRRTAQCAVSAAAVDQPERLGAAEVSGKIFYQQIFRSAGSEKILEGDVYGTTVNGLYSASGEPPAEQGWKFTRDPKEAGSLGIPPTQKKPTFVTDANIEFLVGEFKRSGFVRGLNYYRNVGRKWALTPFLDGAKLRQPTLFIAGDRDGTQKVHSEIR